KPPENVFDVLVAISVLVLALLTMICVLRDPSVTSDATVWPVAVMLSASVEAGVPGVVAVEGPAAPVLVIVLVAALVNVPILTVLPNISSTPVPASVTLFAMVNAESLLSCSVPPELTVTAVDPAEMPERR